MFDFLIFTKDSKSDGIEVRVQDRDVWLTQNAIAQLFDIDRSVVSKHLKKIFSLGELDENSVCAKYAQTADDGKNYNYKFYSLAAIIAVGYRTNSDKATQFRQWATKVLDAFTKQGYVLDKSRLVNGKIFDEDYFDQLVAEIQEIRASERRFYQKITDIYATAADYDKDAPVTREFYATVQNKMHYELIAGIAKDHTFDMAMLEEIVATDNKQRYSFNEDKTLIRANQGHSIPVDVELEKTNPPEVLYHGSAVKFEQSIDQQGLIPKSRLYVHLSKDYDTAVNVGKRHGKPVIYEVLSGKMAQDGYEFFLSANGVWLTKAVPVEYLKKMTN